MFSGGSPHLKSTRAIVIPFTKNVLGEPNEGVPLSFRSEFIFSARSFILMPMPWKFFLTSPAFARKTTVASLLRVCAEVGARREKISLLRGEIASRSECAQAQ
jgi:hypothetical protein